MGKKEKKFRDIEEKRARKYILIIFIYTLIMAGIVAAAILLPGKKPSLPGRENLTSSFSSVKMI